jgi:hypothetical protein
VLHFPTKGLDGIPGCSATQPNLYQTVVHQLPDNQIELGFFTWVRSSLRTPGQGLTGGDN